MEASFRKRILSFFLAIMMAMGVAAPALSMTIAVVTTSSLPGAGQLASEDGIIAVDYTAEAQIPDGAVVSYILLDGEDYLPAAEEKARPLFVSDAVFLSLLITDSEGNEIQPSAPVRITYLDEKIDGTVKVFSLTHPSSDFPVEGDFPLDESEDSHYIDLSGEEDALLVDLPSEDGGVLLIGQEEGSDRAESVKDGEAVFTGDDFTAVFCVVWTVEKKTLTNEEFGISVEYDGYAGIPADVFLKVDELLEAEEYLTMAEEAVAPFTVGSAKFYDIRIIGGDGVEIIPDAPLSVVFDTLLLGEKGILVTANRVVNNGDELTVPGEVGIVWVTEEERTLSVEREGLSVAVEYGPEAGIPVDALLEVEEITEGSPEYEKYVESADKKINGQVNSVTLYDITIRNGEEAVQPKVPVKVTIHNVAPMKEGDKLAVLHFEEEENTLAEEELVEEESFVPLADAPILEHKGLKMQSMPGTLEETAPNEFAEEETSTEMESEMESSNAIIPSTEIENVEQDGESISFLTDGFSVYAVVSYTVDFHWNINGEEFAFSIPGGSYVSFMHLAEMMGLGSLMQNETAERDSNDAEITASYILERDFYSGYDAVEYLNGITVSEKTMEFVKDVKSISFTDSEYLWSGKVETETTVADLISKNALAIMYSEEITEDQIEQINAQPIAAGDWAIISLAPFDSEETLTVTMEDGEQWAMRITDAQVAGELTDGGKYLIYYNSGDTYNVLRNDGYVFGTTNATVLDTLGDEYLWQFDHFNRYGEDYSLIHNGSTYITLNGTVNGILSTTATPVYMTPINDNAHGYRLYGVEYVSVWGPFGYNVNSYLTYNNNQFVRAGNETGNTRIKLWEQTSRSYHFTVKTQYNNKFRGTVAGIDSNGANQTNASSYVGITKPAEKSNRDQIKAVAGPGYMFKEWLLNGEPLAGFNSTIPVGGITFPEDNMVLTAVFEKDPTQPNVGVDDYSQIVENWKQQNIETPITLDKTAQVYDYDNRIYEVELTASALAKEIENDVEMVFVTDISRSMYTPSKLKKVGEYTTRDNLITKLNDLRNRGIRGADGDEVYYLIGDETGTASVFATRYFTGSSNDTTYKNWRWIDCSYDIMKYNDKKGTQGVTGVDKTWAENGSKVGDGYLWQRIGNSNPMALQNLPLNGQIYVAEDVRYRLDYLQQAVDIVSDVLYTVNPSAKTGLVTFAESANNPQGFFGRDEYGNLITALNNISPQGGTNQEAGLVKAETMWTTQSDPDHQRAVMLITDGAPNSSATNWSNIATAAGNLKNNKDVTVHTVGLSVGNVAGARTGLTATAAAGGGGRTMMPDTGTELVESVLDILSTYLKDCNYKGTLHDNIDPVFYPVTKDGVPITPGYYDMSGNPIDKEDVPSYNADGTEYYIWNNNNGSWSITYYNLEYGRGTTESPATIRDFYLKAKEDFLGGNKINTNTEYAHAIATRAIFKHGNTVKVRELENTKEGQAETPYVNIDELHLTQHNTEWTVYLGTKVTPKEQIQALWNNINVKQVLKEGGTIQTQEQTINGETIITPADVTMMKDGTYMWYAHSNSISTDDKAAPLDSDKVSLLPLSYYGLGEYYDAVLTAITDGTSYDSGDIAYAPYGHSTIGNFRITATKVIDPGAEYATAKAPNLHTTDKAVSPAETYTITVTYTPVTTGANTSYEHTTTGGSAGNVTTGTGNDEVKSENTHVINVFQKGFQIRKTDQSSNTITSDTAKFDLYREYDPLVEGEGGVLPGETLPEGEEPKKTMDYMVNGTTYHYIKIDEATTDTNGIIVFNPVDPRDNPAYSNTAGDNMVVPNEDYYQNETHFLLVETKSPDGYNMLTEPIRLTFKMNEDRKYSKETPSVDDTSLNLKWIQYGSITADGVGDTNLEQPSIVEDKDSTFLNSYTDYQDAPSSFDVYHEENPKAKTFPTLYRNLNHVNSVIPYHVINSSGYELPSTGGSTSIPFIALGTVFTVSATAGAPLELRKRRREDI